LVDCTFNSSHTATQHSAFSGIVAMNECDARQLQAQLCVTVIHVEPETNLFIVYTLVNFLL